MPVQERRAPDGLAIRAAWLHYAGGMTQSEVATRLGVSAVKAHRLITAANRSGAIRVTIEGDLAECVAMEESLARRFGLDYCEVVPDLHEPGLPLRALGTAGGAFLEREIARLAALERTGTIGIGNGRTLAAAVEAMHGRRAEGVRFVSLLGGLARNYAANPHDVMHRLASRTGAEAFAMPVPFFANSPADRDVLLAQRGVAEVRALAADADLMLVGVGTVEPDAWLVDSGQIGADEIVEVRRRGGEGEMLGHFFDVAGRAVDTALSARTIGPDLARLDGRRVVAIAGGEAKIGALRAVLASGLLSGLLTDERTAAALVDGTSGAAAPGAAAPGQAA